MASSVEAKTASQQRGRGSVCCLSSVCCSWPLRAPLPLRRMSEALHRNVTRVIDAGRELGVDVVPRHVAQGAKTAQDAAGAIGVDVGQIVKSLIFGVASGAEELELVLAYVSGKNQLNEKLLAAAAGAAKCKRVDADAVRLSTGYPIGDVPPFGHTNPLRVFIDPDLLATSRSGQQLEPGTTSSPSSRTNLFARAVEKSPISASSYAWGQAPFATLSNRPSSTACRSAANAGSSASRTRPRRAVARTEPALPNS